MVNEIEKKKSLADKSLNLFKNNKKKFLISVLILISIILLSTIFNIYQAKQNNYISEQYVNAGIYLSLKENEKAKNVYNEIILSKNDFYSLLALNSIIENELEDDSEKILKSFQDVENITNDKEQKNLIKLKKSLYLYKILKINEGNKLLKEIIAANSIWKEAALEISRQ